MLSKDDSSFVGLLSHNSAIENEVIQLGASACGATAIVNALIALQLVDSVSVSKLDWSPCIVRKRNLLAPLPQYLASRAVAGCTGADLVTSMDLITSLNSLSSVNGSFVLYLEIEANGMKIVDYLADLLRGGKAVIGTFNMQILGNDAWHHQLIYAVDTTTRVVYCMNPISQYPEDLIQSFLSTPSELLIQRKDIIDRLDRPNGDESIYKQCLWQEYNVEGQIESIRTEVAIGIEDTMYVKIPANYVGGLAVFDVN